MKKFLCLLLAVCLVFSFAACTANDQPQDPDTDNPAAGDNAAGSESAGGTAGADTGKEDQDADPSGEDSAQKPDDHQKDDITKEDEASKPEQKPSASTDKPAASKPSASKPSTSKPSADKHDTDKANKPSSPLNLLNTVWKSYSEDDKFPASGGDYSEENAKDDAPGKFDVSDSAVLESTLAVPEDSADLLKKAASLTHMMNLNTFTAGAFQLKDSKNADKFAKAMKESIENRRWVCGFPDKFVIIKVNGYVVSAFGAEDLIDTFKSKTLKAYQDAKVYCEENIE
ncbi:MAG: hypothetical protein ACLUJC_03670 [Clostridia bacterium]